MQEGQNIASSLETRQQDEVNSIASIYGDIFKDVTPSGLVWNKKPSPHFQIFLSSKENIDRPEVEITLDIEFTRTYPLSPPIVRLLRPKNILRGRVVELEKRIKDIIKEYPGTEVAFTLISEINDMLSEFQQTTEQVLSLDQERELRLKNERIALEKLEAERVKEQKVTMQEEMRELSEQILKIRGDSDYEKTNDDNAANYELLGSGLIPQNTDDRFIFENQIVGEIPGTSFKFRFQAVEGFVRHHNKDILSSIGFQYIVKPYLPNSIRDRFGKKDIEISYLFTEIDLTNPYWLTDSGKRDIQDLEKEFLLVTNLSNENVAKLYGFQIDKLNNEGGWKIRLLNEYSSSTESLQDILSAAEYINWAIARSWLIQLVQGVEYLHNSGLIHKAICSSSVFIFDYSLNKSYSDSNSTGVESSAETFKVPKLYHSSYGYKLLYMFECHQNSCDLESTAAGFSQRKLYAKLFIPKDWIAPEVQAENSFHQLKTDIWDLGLLFMRVMLGYRIVNTTYRTPQEFHENFKISDFKGIVNYDSLVFDLLSKMLQVKPNRRPTSLELNASKFLREGPQLVDFKTQFHSYDTKENFSQEKNPHPYLPTNQLSSKEISVPKYSSFISHPYSHPHMGDPSEEAMTNKSRRQDLGRYERDFEEVMKLGKGGFGEVVKARNRIEGTFYAIKKIKHRANKLDSLLREVLSLSRLNHQYIVRYYGTWVEEVKEDHESSLDQEVMNDISSDEEFESPFNVKPTPPQFSRENSFQVDFISSSKLDFDYPEDDGDLNDIFQFGDTDESASASDARSKQSQETFTPQRGGGSTDERDSSEVINQKKFILYIQMEFCENNTLVNLIQQGLHEHPNEYWRLFRQLLEAVSYIHGEGFIHRDLKPSNIFIDRSNNVKVGDFGLAKNSQFSSLVQTNNQVESTDENLSTVVGTLFYTANEVASGHYDEKVDMYSLGIILFEMCYPMSTGMERARTLNNLRLASIIFPKDFNEGRYKTEKKIIQLLLDHVSSRRPGAAELLHSGWLPVAHQDQIIKEVLKNLADPASAWQQQVRETLFNQPYLSAKDLVYDNFRKRPLDMEHSIGDYQLFSRLIEHLFEIFHEHGAIEDYDNNIILPKSPIQFNDKVCEVLDRSGLVLTLPFDLVLPTARTLSRVKLNLPKKFRHEFVYRPNSQGARIPELYSAVSFDIMTEDVSERQFNDAECLKVISEIMESLPCFQYKQGQSLIILNHSDIIDSVINFSFGNVGIDTRKRLEVIELLSQLDIDKSATDIKKYLRQDFNVPHTVVGDLVDGFNFTTEIEFAEKKIQKLMLDSPYFIKIEHALKYLKDVLLVLKKLGFNIPIAFNPLSNYNKKYYNGGIMFQVIHKVDASRRFSRMITGGRYDSLVLSLSNEYLTKVRPPCVVGFSLTSTYLFLLMKSMYLKSKIPIRTMDTNYDVLRWKGSRCDVLVAVTNDSLIKDSGYEILRELWNSKISSDISISNSIEAFIQRSQCDGTTWIVFVRVPKHAYKGKLKKAAGKFKPLRVKNLHTGKDSDVDYNELIPFFQYEIEKRNIEARYGNLINTNDTAKPRLLESLTSDGLSLEGDAHNTADIDQKVTIVPNDAPRGRKNNKKDKWDIESDSKNASTAFIKKLATAPIISIDARDEVLEMIEGSSLAQYDEWMRRILVSASNLPRSFAINIYNTLKKESTKGTQWAILYSPKTEKTCAINLHK